MIRTDRVAERRPDEHRMVRTVRHGGVRGAIIRSTGSPYIVTIALDFCGTSFVHHNTMVCGIVSSRVWAPGPGFSTNFPRLLAPYYDLTLQSVFFKENHQAFAAKIALNTMFMKIFKKHCLQ